ncbi:hypothetical protein PQ455_01855 [Sphingomonas naphthae]|uniref:Uncharacterized protein n=1 Tax=Sphingomonas naphthae TaxID=1813468 RepID=A0ABY7TNN3_9SPHN|nr:hypothetical protein [Sphingomonas naphthae]WCT74005.1 hypothetical protein PQ455_01855 [Sphingomonas naphthae]
MATTPDPNPDNPPAGPADSPEQVSDAGARRSSVEGVEDREDIPHHRDDPADAEPET